jgi:hypothetical protein
MRIICLFLFVSASFTGIQAQGLPSKEDFLNAVFPILVNAKSSKCYLIEEARPCSFIKFDYDEWVKYGLKEDIPLYVLNQLAKAVYDHHRSEKWRQQLLPQAICIDEKEASTILASQKGVFSFSNPAFTENGEYAAIDMSFRCDSRQGGMGATYLFKHDSNGWKLVGRKVSWSSGGL